MDLLDLKKYAIDHRVEIRFGDPHSHHECQISNRGQVIIPGEDRDFRVEDVLEVADKFVISSADNSKKLTREEMALAVGEKKQSAPVIEEE